MVACGLWFFTGIGMIIRAIFACKFFIQVHTRKESIGMNIQDDMIEPLFVLVPLFENTARFATIRTIETVSMFYEFTHLFLLGRSRRVGGCLRIFISN